jgi:tRNA threonylcarbamoyladenosine biosynthesis protein TsaB
VTIAIALDTATDVASLAVARGGEALVEVTLGGRRHAAALLPAVEGAVGLVGASLRDVRRILCADGPGSFTGLRIGFATAQAIARVAGEVTAGTAPSLLAAAWTAGAWHEGPVAAVYDALRNEVFGAVYHLRTDRVEVLVPPGLRTFDELVRCSPAVPTVAVGDGALRHAERAREWTGRTPMGPPQCAPRAAALLALDGLPGGVREVPDLVAFEPDYGRPAEAQARWERAHGRPLPDTSRDGR